MNHALLENIQPNRVAHDFIEEKRMFVISNFIMSLASLIDFTLNAYMWIIIARSILSWVYPNDPYNPIIRFFYEVTEPPLAVIRKKLHFSLGGIDLSPMVLILAIMFLQSFLVPTLQHTAKSIG